ncbi:glycosyltransferase family 2 protein [bacterium]|nr:glycosyltransferase family 2 protein [bacterium]
MKNSKSELITIGIPVYNMSKSILDAINSALQQTYDNIEVLIVDDGSTDDSVSVIRKNIRDKRLRIIEREKNGGVCAAMRDLVDNAHGEYICFLDADDTMMPTRVEKQYKAIKEAEQRYPNRMIASFCGSIVNDITNEKTYEINPRDLFKKYFGGGTGHSMYRVADLQKLGNFDMRFSRSADAMMCVAFLMNNGFYAMVEEPLLRYNFVWDEGKQNVANSDGTVFNDVIKEIYAENPRNLYLRRFAGLPCDDDVAPPTVSNIHIDHRTDIDLFGIKGLRLLSVRHKNNGKKHIVRLFGFIPLLRIKNIKVAKKC